MKVARSRFPPARSPGKARAWAPPVLLALLAAAGCAKPRPETPKSSLDLAALADEYWQGTLAAQPVMATLIGDRRFDHLLEDISVQGKAREEARLEGVLGRARALPEEGLNFQERMSRLALISITEGNLAAMQCGLEEWVVDPMNGPQVSFLNIESYQPVRGIAEAHAMVQRWRAMGPYLDVHASNLARGVAAGKVAVREPVQKVIEQIRALLALPNSRWPLLRPLQTEHPEWRREESAEFRDALTAAVRDVVHPALARYLRFLRREVLPKSRPQHRAGLIHLPGGLDCYRNLIRVHTSLDLPPDDVHGTGLTEVERINREMSDLGARVFKTRDRREILRRLRTDRKLYFESRDAVEDKARSALARATAALPRSFGTLPRAACEVVRMESHEEKDSTIAYYREPAADGSRPGRYTINTYAPRTRPRYEAEALAYHEAIPGHHVQVSIAQELTGVPEFRKYTGSTALVEGWALYAERLADEMGLYTGHLDRLGMLSYDAWRACRLVVDTGIHAKGWSRKMAINYMLKNSALAENNIVNEVDRYINMPGQALAYKIGQLEIRRLRQEARRRLGKRFDIRGFHDAVLGNGALSLDSLRSAIDEYIKWSLKPGTPVEEVHTGS